MAHHYRSDWEWHDDDIHQAASLLDRLLDAAERPTGPDPTPYPARLRHALDDDLDAPGARAVLLELADAILAGGDDPRAPSVLRELGALCGVALDRPAAPVE